MEKFYLSGFRIRVILSIIFGSFSFLILIIALKFVFSPATHEGSKIYSPYTMDAVPTFKLPPLGKDPISYFAAQDQDLESWTNKQRSDPNAIALRFVVMGTPGMRFGKFSPDANLPSYALDNSQAFQGIFLLEPYFPQAENNFIFKVLLDNKEIRVSINGNTFNQSQALNIKRGEHNLYNFTTDPLAEGQHIISFLLFRDTDNYDSSPDTRLSLKDAFSSQVEKIYIKSTNPLTQPEFIDWSSTSTPLPNLQDGFDIGDGTVTAKGIPAWTPDYFSGSEKIEYTMLINNPDKNDREYCVIAFLDYKEVNIQDGNYQTCGIVRKGQLGKLKLSLITPATSGEHQLQLIRFENPLLKGSYIQAHPEVRLPQLTSSSRVLIKVK